MQRIPTFRNSINISLTTKQMNNNFKIENSKLKTIAMAA